MLRGRFGNTSARPYIEGRVVIGALRASANISFCFDTGADATLIMPPDSQRLRVNFGAFPAAARTPLYGIGRGATGIVLPASVSFFDADSKQIFVYQVPVVMADPHPSIATAPSLLGRNIIHRWRVRYEGGARILEADVLSADVTIAVP